MNNLVGMNGAIGLTSLDIARLTGKLHKNIIRDIRTEMEVLGEEIGGLIFEPGTYLDKNNQSRAMYNLTEDGVMQLALKYDSISRYKCIQELKRLKELENKTKTPQTFIEAMQLATQALIEKERVEKELLESNEKITKLTHSGKLYTASEIAKELGFRSTIEFNKYLSDKKIQYKVNKTWVLTANYSELGYTSIKQFELENGKIVYDRKWTGIGRDFLTEFAKLDII